MNRRKTFNYGWDSLALIGDELLFPGVPFNPWVYGTLSAVFLIFHNLHTMLVYSRGN
jgi:hypothetical protein